LATGVWNGLDALSATWKRRDRFEPAMDGERRRQLIEGWHSAVAKTLSS